MRSLALLALLVVACPSEPKKSDAWPALMQRYPIVDGEWEAVVRVMSLARRAGLDAPAVVEYVQKSWPKPTAEMPKELASTAAQLKGTFAEVSTTGTIAGVAAAKDLDDLTGAAQIVLLASKPDDPAVAALVGLVNDMRLRGGVLRAAVSAVILRDTALWSAANGKVPALDAIQPTARDFTAAVAREVIGTVQKITKANEGKDTQIAELRAFASERIASFEKAGDNFSALRKVANWRDEPDAIDHPLISLIARNWTQEIEDFERMGDALAKLRQGTLKPPARATPPPPSEPEPGCEPIVLKGVKRSGQTIDVPRAEADRAFANAECITEQARVVPFFEGQRVIGFQISDIKKGGVFAQLGLEDGDVIEQIAGTALSTPDATVRAYDDLKKAASADIVLKRKSRTVTLTWRRK
jgi:general secretion pathway protein C